MRSIRAQLLGWLLPSFVVVCAAAGMGVYYSAKQAIETDVDAQVSRLAGAARLALRNQLTAVSRRERAPALRAFLAKEEFQTPGQYFQLWTASGQVEQRSPNLGKEDLPRPHELTREAIRYDGDLEDGRRVRLAAMQFPQGAGIPPLDFAVGVSQSEGEARLSRLLRDLVIGGIGCCAVLCLLLVLALRYALRPLVRVGEQATAMGTRSMHERFASEALPLEIAPIVTRLNDLMGRLEQGFQRERRFSGYLAHELRTPLAAIRATSEVAAKWPEQSSPNDFYEIAQAATRLQQTVDSLLMLARVETTPADVSLQAVALGPLVEECVALHLERAGQRKLRFDQKLDPSFILETDPRMLRIIVTNLIANATEYAPPGTAISIEVKPGDPFLRVGNPAPDLTPEDLPRLFDRLWRKDATRSDDAHSGLGLSIARSCALALGMTLHADLDDNGAIYISLHHEE
jgi:signal transduction histidine kinase